MHPTDIAHLTERVRLGLPTVVLGTLPPLPKTLGVVRVRCDLPGTLGPLDRACLRIERLLDGDATFTHHPAARHRALDVDGRTTLEERFAAACQRLATRAPGVAVVLDSADRADPTTHKALARVLGGPSNRRLPIILVVRDEPRGTFLDVLRAMARPVGSDGTAAPPPHSNGASTAPHIKRIAAPEPSPAPIPELDRDALRVLRAAAVVGATFESSVVARLLGLPNEGVLESLQTARDAGLPLIDDGAGHFEMPGELRQLLVASILPSLRVHWHGLLGELFSEPAAADPLRSAAHLGDAGDPERAVERRFDAVAMLVRAGDIERATEQLAAATDEISSLPRGPFRSMVRARAKVEKARLGWLGAGSDASFTLQAAFALAIEALAELGDRISPALRSDIASTIAGIAYDLGDTTSLERAQTILGETSATLLDGSSAVLAATLLNDQAAIALQMGQRIRTLDLLGRSREILTAHLAKSPSDTTARLDLAHTHHLLARLPLHGSSAAASPDAIPPALDYARAAELIYQERGMRRDVGRVIETRARLLARRGELAAARAAFASAMQIADEVGDVTGLARITAGLAELLSSSGDPGEALNMLVSSIELNREKGSPIGLELDGRVLDEVERMIASLPGSGGALRDEIARARARLAAAVASTP